MPRIEMHIAKPCNQSWTAMKGDERVRFCGSCRKNVYNLTEMSEAEIEELVRQTDGKFCGRLYRRTDNRVMQQDCPKGVAAVRRRIGFAIVAALSGAYALLSPAYVQGKVRTRPIARPLRMHVPVLGAAIAHSAPSDEEEALTMGKVMVEPDVRMSDVRVIPKRPSILK